MQEESFIPQNNYNFSQKSKRDYMYQQLLLPVNKQYIKIQYAYQNSNRTSYFRVTDELTIKELKKKWIQENSSLFQEQNNSMKQENFVLMWDDSLVLRKYMKIMDLKKTVQIPYFNGKNIFRIFYDPDGIQSKQNQVSLNYEEFEKKYHMNIDITVKLQTQNNSLNGYFYVQCKIYSTLKDFKQKVQQQLTNSNSPLNYNPKLGYSLLIKINFLSEEELKRIRTLKQKCNPLQMDQQGQFIDITACDKIKVRQICPPEEFIFIRLHSTNQMTFNSQINLSKDPYINIVCFNSHSQNLQSGKFVITRKFSDIYNLKVQTLLKQYNVQDPLFTSLFFNEKITLKHFQRFCQLQQEIKKLDSKEYSLFLIPQNLLFYKQIYSQQKDKNIKMEELIQYLVNYEDIEFNEQSRTQYRKIIDERKKSQKPKEINDEDFLKPLILYTSPNIYHSFNLLIRESSVSQFKSEAINSLTENLWHYPLCQKMLNSLLKLPNFHGTVYRGNIHFDYNCKTGDILEWNSFISTSKNSQKAKKFWTKSPVLPYFFQIQTCSGKQIGQYSYYPQQNEVIILPYTKFKVIQVYKKAYKLNLKKKNNQNMIKEIQVPYIKLRQLPIPKRIPGNLVVWIDSRPGGIQENLLDYNRIIRRHPQFSNFDLIQLLQNEHLKQWISEFKQIFLQKEVNILFITNMNKPPDNEGGVKTLEIIRNVQPNARVVFYVGYIPNAMKILEKHNKLPDERIEIINASEDLQKIFKKNL